jgi:hypothetical protein
MKISEKVEAKSYLSVVLWRARQLGLSYNLAGREDDPDNYKSIQSRDGINGNVVRSKTRRGVSKWRSVHGVQS